MNLSFHEKTYHLVKTFDLYFLFKNYFYALNYHFLKYKGHVQAIYRDMTL